MLALRTSVTGEEGKGGILIIEPLGHAWQAPWRTN